MIDLIEEVWKPIKDLRGFEISNKGNVRSYRKSNSKDLYENPHPIKKSSTSTSPYLYFNTTGGRRCVHREVAKAFIPNPDNLATVDHKNRDIFDNSVENLEWLSQKDNNIHAHGKYVKVINPDGDILEFNSVGELSRAIGVDHSNGSRFVNKIYYKNGLRGWKLYA